MEPDVLCTKEMLPRLDLVSYKSLFPRSFATFGIALWLV